MQVTRRIGLKTKDNYRTDIIVFNSDLQDKGLRSLNYVCCCSEAIRFNFLKTLQRSKVNIVRRCNYSI